MARQGPAALLLAVLFTGCRTDAWARAGDRQLAEGAPGPALAYYTQGLGHRPGDAALEDGQRRAVAALAEQWRVSPEPRRALDEAFALAQALPEAAEVLRSVVDLHGRRLLVEASAQLQGGASLAAGATARLLADRCARYPGGGLEPLLDEVRRLTQRVREAHEARAGEGDPARAALHRWLVGQYGGPLAPWAPELFPPPAVALRLRGAPCPWLERALASRYPPPPGGAALALTLEVERCTSVAGEPVVRQELVLAQVPAPRLEERLETVFEDAPLPAECAAPACQRYDELGVCVAPAPLPARCAEPRRRVEQKRAVPRLSWAVVAEPRPRTTWERELQVELTASLRSAGAGGHLERPVRVKRNRGDSASWSVDQSRPFTVTLAQLEAEVVAEVAAAVEELRRVPGERRRQEVAARIAALSAGHEREREALLVEAALTSGQHAELSQWLTQRYGAPPDSALPFYQRGALPPVAPPPPWQPTVPYPGDASPWVAEGPAPRGPRRGLAARAESGFELAYLAAGAPQTGADWAGGVSFTLRIGQLALEVAGMTPGLGGQVAGMRLGMLGGPGDIDEWGWDYQLGLEYETLRAEDGERLQIFTLPLLVYLRLLGPLSLELGLRPNLLAFEGLVDADAGDPRHYSPLSARLRLDAGQLMLALGVVHYLGAPSGEGLHLSAAAGVRL